MKYDKLLSLLQFYVNFLFYFILFFIFSSVRRIQIPSRWASMGSQERKAMRRPPNLLHLSFSARGPTMIRR